MIWCWLIIKEKYSSLLVSTQKVIVNYAGLGMGLRRHAKI